MDINNRIVILDESQGGFDRPPGFDERGLLGLDFHPNFEENGLFYVRYSSRNPVSDGEGLTGPDDRTYPEDWDHIEVLSEFQVTETTTDTGGTDTDGEAGVDGNQTVNGNESVEGNQTVNGDTAGGGATEGAGGGELIADLDTQRVLLEIPSPQFNHNGGEVTFGPDGYLYTSIGDGGDGNDTGVGHVEDWYDGNEGGNAQNVEENLLGSVLRIDVDEEGEDKPYAVPDDNPLVGTSGYDEIYAYGLRNPWRMSFNDDQLVTADVGQAMFEEVDVIENGGNYGWNVREGFHCFDAADATSPPEDCPTSEPDEAPYDGSEFVDPVLEYPHRYQGSSVGISITSGYVPGNDAVGELSGRYVFGDWSAAFADPQGRIFVADMGAEGMEDGEGMQDDGTTDEGAMPGEDTNATDGNETMTDGNETMTGGNETMTGGNETMTDGDGTGTGDGAGGLVPAMLQTGNESDEDTGADAGAGAGADAGTGGNETQEQEQEQDQQEEEEEQAQPQPAEETDITPPDEHPWPWEEVLIEGGENNRLNRFIQAFGRDNDGNLYVLASRTGRVEGEEGEIFRIVPAGEGGEVQVPDVEVPEPGDEETEEEETDADTAEEPAADGTTGNATADGNETAGGDEPAQ